MSLGLGIGLNKETRVASGPVVPPIIDDGNTIGRYDYLQSVTTDASDFVSNWGDLSGNSNDLAQGVGSFQPLLNADGILFDGVDNRLQATFTYNQPCFYYMVLKPVTYTNADYFIDGATAAAYIRQFGGDPITEASAGIAKTLNLSTGSYYILRVSFNGASGFWRINEDSPSGNNLGTNNPGGFTLGSQRSGIVAGNIEVKGIILRTVTDSAGDQQIIYNYLNSYYSLGL